MSNLLTVCNYDKISKHVDACFHVLRVLSSVQEMKLEVERMNWT